MQLSYIAPDNLRSVWPRIRDDIAAIQAKSPEGWWAEDVYHALKGGKAQLLLAGEMGWLVTMIEPAEWTGEPIMHVWVAYSAPEAEVIDEAMDQLKELAARSGCTAIRFGSRRPGWIKRYTVHSVTYEVQI